MNNLNGRQQLFVDEYIIDYNATQACIRAKYSKKTAYSMGHRLLKKVEIQEAIQKARKAQIERLQIDADYVLLKLYQWVEADPEDIIDVDGAIKPFDQWPKAHRQFLSGIEVDELFDGKGEDREQVGYTKKIKFPDKLKAIQALGNHKAIQAFKENKIVEHSGEIKHNNSDLSESELDARIAELENKLGNGK